MKTRKMSKGVLLGGINGKTKSNKFTGRKMKMIEISDKTTKKPQTSNSPSKTDLRKTKKVEFCKYLFFSDIF